MFTLSSRVKFILLSMILSFGLLACGQDIPATTPSPTITKDIFPYLTPNVDLPSSTQAHTTSPPMTPVPTATPFAHTIEKGDTLLGIALRYGVDVNDLQALNPDLDPNMLSVGSQVKIPLGDEVQNVVMTPTPIPIALPTPKCHLTSDGGAWCFILVENIFTYALENVSASVGLYANQDRVNAEKIAFPPLNRIGSGDRVPLMVFFPSPVPAIFSARAELLTAVSIPDNSNRYINGVVEINDVNIHENDKKATVHGQLSFPDDMQYPALVWLAAVAYGNDGEVVGVRKWEAIFPREEPLPISSGTPDSIVTLTQASVLPLSFQVDVYSLGPAIKQVEIVLEARP